MKRPDPSPRARPRAEGESEHEPPVPPLPKGAQTPADVDATLLASGEHDQKRDGALETAKGRFSQLIDHAPDV
jgi:hypothetical protein